MSLTDESTSEGNHVLHHFDENIARLRKKLADLGDETLSLWNLNREALLDGNLKLASDVLARNTESKMMQLEIEQTIIELLAKEQPVAGDLRFVVSTMKLAHEFRSLIKIAHEMASLILDLYVPQHGAPTLNLMVNLYKLDLRMYYLVSRLIEVINNQIPKYSLQLLADSESIRSSIQHELIAHIDAIKANPQPITPALTLLQMMKALESCSSNCENLARYCCYMIDGIDLQQRSSSF